MSYRNGCLQLSKACLNASVITQGKGNFFSIDIIDDQGKVMDYDVFFAASRSSGKNALNLFVQSAYMRDAQHGTNRPHKKPLSFYVILYNVLNNKAITMPK